MDGTRGTGRTRGRSTGGRRTIPGFLVLGACLLLLGTVALQACEKATPGKQKAGRMKPPTREYWESLFKDDPASLEEFRSILAGFRRATCRESIEKLERLLEQHPGAPWAESVDFFLGQAWRLLQDYPHALRQLDLFLKRYPESPGAPYVLLYLGQTYLAAGRQYTGPESSDSPRRLALTEAIKKFQEVLDKYDYIPALRDEAGCGLGEAYSELGELDRAVAAFKKVAEGSKDSAWASKALYELAGVHMAEADVIGARRAYEELVERFPKKRLGVKAAKKLKGLELVGRPVPPLQIKEWIGPRPPVADGKWGKLTLLDFWAIWCPHCRKNIPRMEQLQEAFSAKGVSVVGITREREGYGPEEIREFIRKHPMNYPTGIDDDGKTSASMAVSSVPCVVAVDAGGGVCWYGHPEYLSDTTIEALLERSPSPGSDR